MRQMTHIFPIIPYKNMLKLYDVTRPEIISSKWYTLSSCSHVAVAPEGTVRISITETERSARQIVDDFVKLVHSDSSISTYRMCAHEPLQTTEDYTFSYSSNNSSSMLRHKRQQILFK